MDRAREALDGMLRSVTAFPPDAGISRVMGPKSTREAKSKNDTALQTQG